MRTGALVALALAAACAAHTACGSTVGSSAIPTRLSDDQFRELTTAFAEAPGAFTGSDNLVSNETHFVHLVRLLRGRGGVYIGVGPEQNFSYIARLRPTLAFIIDLRQENRALHLLYKALFELSADRADFLSRLFSRERPAGLGRSSSVHEMFAKYGDAPPAAALYEANLHAVRARLLQDRGLPLSSHDLDWIEHALRAFRSAGTEIAYAQAHPGEPPAPSYRILMTATDVAGQPHSYLATEEAFAFVRELHARNLIVPVVGDFAGRTALRRAGDYIRQHGETVTVFYGSNVEVYLNRQKKGAFCDNLATLPHDRRSWFVGSKRMQPFAAKLKSCHPAPR